MKSLVTLSLLAALSGCATVEGFGRDLAAGGEALEEAAVEAQRPEPRPVYRAPQQQPVYPSQSQQQVYPAQPQQPVYPAQPQQQTIYRNPTQQQPTYTQPPPGSQYVY